MANYEYIINMLREISESDIEIVETTVLINDLMIGRVPPAN